MAQRTDKAIMTDPLALRVRTSVMDGVEAVSKLNPELVP